MPVAGPLVGGDSWSDKTGQRGIQEKMSSSNSLAPTDPLLAFSLVVSERSRENIAPRMWSLAGPKDQKGKAVWIFKEMEHSGTELSEFIGRRTLSQHLEEEMTNKTIVLKWPFRMCLLENITNVIVIFLFIC